MGHEPLALFKLSTCLEGEIACRDRWRLLLAILVISNGGIACNVRRLLPAQRGGGAGGGLVGSRQMLRWALSSSSALIVALHDMQPNYGRI